MINISQSVQSVPSHSLKKTFFHEMGESVEELSKAKNSYEDLENETGDGIEETEQILDLRSHLIKPDYFDGIEIIHPKHEKIEGAPNFRQLTGFPIFGTGQPTREGMVKIIQHIKKEKENMKIIWFSMRQEPVVYVNGSPYAPRNPNNPHKNILTPDLDDGKAKLVRKNLASIVRERVNKEDKTIKIHVDREFAENPLDRIDIEESIVVESVNDLDAVFELCSMENKVQLQVIHIPVVEDEMPTASCFDSIISGLKEELASTPCVFSCQMGKGRTTVGMLVASLVKEIQITTELR